MLGPHVVGQRVVVRRLLRGETGPTGGPAMTDVLGVCESWADGVVAVRREDGTLVSFPTADIVSGKPVPPRPSVRLRVSARDAEQHALALWPEIEKVSLGEWTLRSDPAPVGRLLNRANSCLAFGAEPADAVGAVRSFYEARGRTPLAQVEVGSAAETLFAGAGWSVVPGGDAHFLLASTARALRLLASTSASTSASSSASTLASTSGGVDLAQDGALLTATLTDAGSVVASASAAFDGDWVGVHSLLVVPERRREGLARTVMAAVLERAAEHGATTTWLHVETDNHPALTLYDGLGFAVHHTNRYFAPPSPDAPAPLRGIVHDAPHP